MASSQEVQRATFQTGASWVVGDDHIIHMALGPWQSEDEGLEEAEFMQEQFKSLKAVLPASQQVSAIVDLQKISQWETAHLAMLAIYASMTKDPVTRRVAICRSTGMQKVLIVPLIKLVVHNRKKLQFFDDLESAEAWVKSS